MAIVFGNQDRNASSKGSKNSGPLYGKRVLIADDSSVQRKKLRELYESLGLVCIGEASDGLECLGMAEKTNPDLISIDVLMPVMHGVETLGYLRKAGNQSLVVFVSALSNIEVLTEVRSMGYAPDAVFSKKDTREAFLEVLTAVFTGEMAESSDDGDVISDSKGQKSA
jgi:CheY-like chemotaxis protein